MFVVGNKYDSAQTERSVSQAEASTFAQAIGAYFFEVSALSNLGKDINFLLTFLNLELHYSRASQTFFICNPILKNEFLCDPNMCRLI